MSSASLILLDAHPALAAEESFLPAEKRLSGNPKQTLWMQYTDPSGRFFVGVWRSEPGKWRVAYTEEEWCEMLAGRSIVTDETGHAVELKAGDCFVVPRGFAGTWEVVETSLKRFVVYEPGACSTPPAPA